MKTLREEIAEIVNRDNTQSGPVYFPYTPLFITEKIGGYPNDGYYLVGDHKVSVDEYNKIYKECENETEI